MIFDNICCASCSCIKIYKIHLRCSVFVRSFIRSCVCVCMCKRVCFFPIFYCLFVIVVTISRFQFARVSIRVFFPPLNFAVSLYGHALCMLYLYQMKWDNLRLETTKTTTTLTTTTAIPNKYALRRQKNNNNYNFGVRFIEINTKQQQ